MIKVSDYVIKFIEALGVKEVFTVSGGGSIFLCDSLQRSKTVKYVACHHEQAASIATEGYARTRGDIGVTIVTTGPGGTNAVTGIAGSWMDSIPHLCISGQSFLSQTIGNSGLRQLGVQEINIADIIRPITKYAVMIEDAQTIRYHLEKAVYLAKSGRPGPVWVDIPANIQNTLVDEATLKSFDENTIQIPEDVNLKEKVSQLIQKLKISKRPLIHVGQGVKLANRKVQFLKLIEKYNFPIVTARNANDIIASDHPLFIGRPGTFPQRGANFAVQNSDFYLAIGTRLSLSQTGYNSKDFAKNAFRVMVDIDQTELDKKSLILDLKIHADVRNFLDEFEKQLSDANLKQDHTDWIKYCKKMQNKYPVLQKEYVEQTKFVNSYYFTEVLSNILDKNDVIVTDMGIAFQGTHQGFKVKQGQKLFTNCGLAAMGWGLPAAVGACFANNRKRTICIAGEGGLMMNIQELATMMHHKLPIKLFILNNGGYMTIKQTQELGFEGRIMGCNPESGLSFPDFKVIAQAHGMQFTRLDSHKNLESELQKAIEGSSPFICEIMMDENQIQAPKAINRRNADGTTRQTPLEDLFPFLDPKEIEENMIAYKK